MRFEGMIFMLGNWELVMCFVLYVFIDKWIWIEYDFMWDKIDICEVESCLCGFLKFIR